MFYSPSQNAFYARALIDRYQAAGTWPADAIEVTKEEWQTYGQSQPPAGYRRGSDESGRPTWVEIPPESVDDLATAAIRRINTGYSAAMAMILNEYPDAETLSFDKQEAQAREWQAWHDPAGNNGQGSEPATPYIDAILAERPIGKAELVSRIIAKADQFTAAHGSATGRRQRLEDDVKAALAAEDREGIETVVW